jgi:hypothetical protein
MRYLQLFIRLQDRETIMSKWELKDDSEVSWWHCDRAGYWEGQDVYCSKCQTKLEEVA